MRHNSCKRKQVWAALPTRLTLYVAIVSFSVSTCVVSAFILWKSNSSVGHLDIVTTFKLTSKRLMSTFDSTTTEESAIEYFAVTEENGNSKSEMSEKEFHLRVRSTPAPNTNKVCEPFLRRIADARGFCKDVSSQPMDIYQRRPIHNTDASNAYEVANTRKTKSGSYTKSQAFGVLNVKQMQKKRLLISMHSQARNKWIYYRREFHDELKMTIPSEDNDERETTMDKFHTPSGVQNRSELILKWCPIFKAASSPWMAIFTKLSGALTPVTEKRLQQGKLSFLTLVKDFRLNVPKTTPRLSKTYSMVVVRHPFERILSAYRDKIERTQGREYYVKKYRKHIINKFRRSPYLLKKLNETEKTVLKKYNMDTLHRTVSDVIHQDSLSKRLRMANGLAHVYLERFPSTDRSTHGHKRAQFPVPTFDEFIQYLLTMPPMKMDEHWRPMYIDCSPCWNRFDFILKVETMAHDRDKILTELLRYDKGSAKYEELLDVWKRWQNKTPAQHYVNETATKYYSQISRTRLKKLYEIYEYDFKLFQYDPQPYFQIGASSPIPNPKHDNASAGIGLFW